MQGAQRGARKGVQMSESTSAAEWLRGIIDECDASKTHCSAIAEAFGIDCWHEKTCRWCIAKMMTAIAYRIDLDMVGYERLKKESAELKAELADWKGNAEGFQPDAYMKLPLDADGEPIRVGDVLYSSGNECRVVSITVKADEACIGVHTDEGVFLPSVNPKYLSRKKPEPADSWERLEEDMMRGTSCRYFGGVESALECWDCPHGTEQTGTPCWKNERIDILKRAKKLAGIEEEVRNGD
nr:MAG TPA: hypothetical protein [Caudoviricetes sp.]